MIERTGEGMASVLLVEDSAICVEMVHESFAEFGYPDSVSLLQN